MLFGKKINKLRGLISRHARCQYELAKLNAHPDDYLSEESQRIRNDATKASDNVFKELNELRDTPHMTAWGFVNEKGEHLIDMGFKDAEQAWQVGLGWPSPEEIEEAKGRGCYVARFAIIKMED